MFFILKIWGDGLVKGYHESLALSITLKDRMRFNSRNITPGASHFRSATHLLKLRCPKGFKQRLDA